MYFRLPCLIFHSASVYKIMYMKMHSNINLGEGLVEEIRTTAGFSGLLSWRR